MHKLLLAYLIALCSISLGCIATFNTSNQQVGMLIKYKVYVSKNFPPDIDYVVRSSFKEWQSRLPGIVEFDFQEGYTNCLANAYSICVKPATPKEIGGRAGLTTSDDNLHSANIFLSTDNYVGNSNWEETTKVSSLHEDLHAMGVNYHLGPGHIMSEDGSKASPDITKDDVVAYLKVRGFIVK